MYWNVILNWLNKNALQLLTISNYISIYLNTENMIHTTLQRSCTGSTCANPTARSGRSPADLPLQLYTRVCRWAMKGRHVHSAWLGLSNRRIEPAIKPRELEYTWEVPWLRHGEGERRGWRLKEVNYMEGNHCEAFHGERRVWQVNGGD